MERFETLGQLLIGYRAFAQLSQTDLGAMLNVDNRTIIRWEKNASLLKSDKEEELADVTFIPYQVIRNLNASMAIPTYYDFKLRKYATHEAFSEVPHADWLKSLPPIQSSQLQEVTSVREIELMQRCLKVQGKNEALLNKETVLAASEMLPQLNFILFDNAGFYCGHCLIMPISQKAYVKIKNQVMHPSQLEIKHLQVPAEDDTVFFALDFNADSNENLFRLSAPIRAYFGNRPNAWTYASFTSRPDTKLLNTQFGNTLVWKHQHELDNEPVQLFEKVVVPEMKK